MTLCNRFGVPKIVMKVVSISRKLIPLSVAFKVKVASSLSYWRSLLRDWLLWEEGAVWRKRELRGVE